MSASMNRASSFREAFLFINRLLKNLTAWFFAAGSGLELTLEQSAGTFLHLRNSFYVHNLTLVMTATV
jgi:hypothetical protein